MQSNYPQGNVPPYSGQPAYTPSLQQGYAQPMPPTLQQSHSLPKKPRRWPWIVAILIALMIGYGVGSASHSDTTTTTTTVASIPATAQPASRPTGSSRPAALPKWTTTHTFSGNGAQKTATFNAPGDWKLNWSCNLAASTMGDSYNVIVGVNNSDGTPVDPAAINTLCKSGNTSGSTEERQSGDVYLDVNSEDNWKITVQELK